MRYRSVAFLALLPLAAAQEPCTLLTQSVSQRLDGNATNGPSWFGTVSGDGQRVAFESWATNVVPGDSNGVGDVFVRDLTLGAVQRVSLSTQNWQGDKRSGEPLLSYDGSKVVFLSDATNLVPGDTNDERDVFLRDLVTHQTTLVSQSTTGAIGNGGCYEGLAISRDGNLIAFASYSTNFAPSDTNGDMDLFIRDLSAGTTTRVMSAGGLEPTRPYLYPSFADNGRYLAFHSHSTDLVPGDANSSLDVFLRDRLTGATEIVSLADGGGPSDFHSFRPVLSEDARFVAFSSISQTLVPGADPTGFNSDVYVHDRLTSRTTRESWSPEGVPAVCASVEYALSEDGSVVAFRSTCESLVAGDTNGWADIFVRQRETGRVCIASKKATGEENDAPAGVPVLTADGVNVGYHTYGELTPIDGPASDVFLTTVRPGAGEVLCSGDPSHGACPCSNPGTLGEGCATSTGRGARLRVEGSGFLAVDDLAFTATDLLPYQTALLFAAGVAPVQPFGDGMTCVSSPQMNLDVEFADAAGMAEWSGGLLSSAGATFGTAIVYQVWFRDSGSPCGTGFNFTPGVRILPAL